MSCIGIVYHGLYGQCLDYRHVDQKRRYVGQDGKEKAEMTYKFEEYVNENKDTDYALPWSEWLKQQELKEAA